MSYYIPAQSDVDRLRDKIQDVLENLTARDENPNETYMSDWWYELYNTCRSAASICNAIAEACENTESAR